MSSDDYDAELMESIIEALEKNGTLAKLKAQLRASVFHAMEEHENVQGKTVFRKDDVQKFITTEQGRLCSELLLDFLVCLKLEASVSVFKAEMGMTIKGTTRLDLASKLGLPLADSEVSGAKPLLQFLIEKRTATDKKDMFEDSFFASPVATGSHNITNDDFKSVDVENDDFFGHSPPFTLPDTVSIASTVTQRPRLTILNAASDPEKGISMNEVNIKPTANKDSSIGIRTNGFSADLPEIQPRSSSSPFPPLVLPRNDRSEDEMNDMKRIDLKKLLGNNDDSPRQSDASDKSSNDNKNASTRSERTKPVATTKFKSHRTVLSKIA